MTTERTINIGALCGHGHCLMCGDDNPDSLGLCFRVDDADSVVAEFRAQDKLQGYEGILHGGVISALLDAAMTHCLFHRGVRAVTGDLHVRYLQPVPCRSKLRLRARIKISRPPVYRVTSEIDCEDRTVARAEGTFMRYEDTR